VGIVHYQEDEMNGKSFGLTFKVGDRTVMSKHIYINPSTNLK
jgi:hypothetical protein